MLLNMTEINLADTKFPRAILFFVAVLQGKKYTTAIISDNLAVFIYLWHFTGLPGIFRSAALSDLMIH